MLLGLTLVSCAFARVGVNRLSLCLPYVSVLPFTLLPRYMNHTITFDVTYVYKRKDYIIYDSKQSFQYTIIMLYKC